MYCKKCGKYVPSDAKFCPYCGKSLNRQNNFKMFGLLKELVEKYKPLSYIYMGWLLANITLWLFASNTHYNGRAGESYDISDGFYPFPIPLFEVISYSYYDSFSLIENIDVYDFSEFYFYTLLLPLSFLALQKTFQYIFKVFKGNRKSIETHSKSDENKDVRLVVMPSTPEDETVIKGGEKSGAQNKEEITSNYDQQNISKVKSDKKECSPFPLWRRAIGSAIDKFLILVLFLVGYEAFHPYSCFGNIGLFIGLLGTTPTSYEYVDRTHIANYGSYYEGIDKDYQDNVYKEEGKPYLGQTKDIIMSMTYSFVLWNIFYYILFEFLLCASPGKYIMGGRLYEFEKKLRRIGKVLLRGIILGALLFTLVFLFQYEKIANYYILILAFFIILDIPLLFTAFSMKCSLLDLLSNTNYVDVLRKEDLVGKYKYEIKKV